VGEGRYCGSSGVTTPYNAYCYFHCDYRPWGGNPPAEDSGWDWETALKEEDKKEYNVRDDPHSGDPPNDD